MPLKVATSASDSDKHEWEITFLLYHKGKLYSASDDGKIKLWSQELKLQTEIQAHPCSVYCLAASEDTLYSCSNDGTIKAWELESLKEKSTLVKSEEVEFWRVAFSNGRLFAGDDQGNITVYKDNRFYGQVNIAEPIKDMAVHENFVFTVKDLDLVVTEVKSEKEKIQFGTKVSHMGRAPVALIDGELFAFITREGKEIQLHEIKLESGFQQVARITGSDLIINALAGTKWNDQLQFFSGGWDKILKRWTIEKNYPSNESSLDVEVVINCICTGETGQVFVGGADGHLIRIDVN